MSTVTAGDALLDALADRLAGRVVEQVAERVVARVLPLLESQAEREALSLDATAEALSVSRSTVKRLIADGHLDSKLVGQRRIVPVEAVRRFVQDHASVDFEVDP